MRIIVIVPAYNEETIIEKVVRDVKKYADEVLVIDDGSNDNTGRKAKENGAKVYRHFLNRGLGAALATGFAAALRRGADVAVTFDADGQHKAEDIPRLIKPIISGQADAVIGSRLINVDGMPFLRQFYNWVGNLITYVLFGAWTTDSQSGLRAFSREALKKIAIKTNRMEVSSEIIEEIGKNKLRLKEIPIKAIYTDYSLSKGQSFKVGLKTFFNLILKKIVK